MIRTTSSIVLSLALGFATAAPASAFEAGEVLWGSKINFQPPNNLGLVFSDQFGRAVDVIGDLDGDGIDEIAVGASHSNDGGMIDSGAFWILFLNPDATVRESRRIGAINGGFVGPLSSGDQFGKGLGAIGDLDGDMIPDIAVAAPKDSGGDGAVYILFLNADGTVKAEQKIGNGVGGFDGPFSGGWSSDGDEFGRSIVRMGDMDGDGVTEIAVGSSNHNELGNGSYGVMYILYMNTDGTVKDWSRIDQGNGGFSMTGLGFFGISADNVGDWDGNGINDLMVGASHENSAGPSWAGTVYLFTLNADGSVIETTKITDGFNGFDAPLETSDQFGREIAFLGDVDGDGIDDIAVGASEDDDGPMNATNTGAVYVMFMNADKTVREYQKISNTAGRLGFNLGSNFEFGISLAGLGDFNGDSVPDIVVGARFDTGRGAIYVLNLNDGNQAPANAQFTAAPALSGPQPLTVQFTDTSTGNVSNWSWDFGDGGSSTLQNPEHTYNSQGTFTVTLVASGTGGTSTRVRNNLITVDPPVTPMASFSGSPLNGPAPLDVLFTDSSTGGATSWSWDFGDGGMSTAQNPMHQYTAEGTYTVTLNVTGPGGADSIMLADYVTVTEAVETPVAEFSGTPLSGDAPLLVSFSDLSTGGVTSWSWSFGDGGSSTEASPSHEYLQPGDYTVSLMVSGPGGSDSMIKADYVSVAVPPAPVADFMADPTTGFAPLAVQFTDLSTGYATSWSWDIGGEYFSNEQNPSFLITEPGIYGVLFTVTGPGGSDTIIGDSVAVQAPPVGELGDPSFEIQPRGLPPGPPWEDTSGADNTVRGLDVDHAMPSEGDNWLEVSADGTFDATPPSNPGGTTDPAIGGAMVSQSFLVVDGRSEMSFAAAFLLDGVAASEPFNDWMSIDVTDGVTTENVYYQDTFSDFSETSELYGLPMTAVERIVVDLADRFPGHTGSTVFTLTIQVGNGGDDLGSSIGYVDDILFAAPIPEIQRYGCDLNPVNSLTVVGGKPAVGSTFTIGIDNPLGTQGPNSLPVLFVSFDPDPNFPCGTSINGFGMAGGGAPGELLVSLLDGNPVVVLVGPPWSTPGVPSPVNLNIPANPSLVDRDIYLQGYIRDDAMTFGLRIGLTDAIKVTLGE